ncbi:MAG TPA: DinB family protein [Mycobacteriales bacterium]|nr:DinB family protein [Mycobacteriales bacterium]
MSDAGFVYSGDFDVQHTRELAGRSYFLVDLSGSRFRDCDISHVRFVDCFATDVVIGGDVQRLVVNDVDVTAYVEGELDRRYPERVPIRALRAATEPKADDVRALWRTVRDGWTATVARAEQLPEDVLHERVEDEWSFVETLRHLTFAIDAWASRTILDEERPYHRLGLPAGGYPAGDAAALGLELRARPTYAEAKQAWQSRQAVIDGIVAGVTDAELLRMCTRTPAPGYPEQEVAVHRCLRVVLAEETEHRRYAERDLAVLEGRSG